MKKIISKEQYAVKLVNVTKTFANGSIIANDHVNLNIRKNEIHALVGENGAGKSTLMSALFGLYAPDSGEIYVNDQQVHFKSAQDAARHGLGMVHQHFKLVGVYTLLENIILGAEKTKRGFLDKKSAATRINEIATRYNLDINPKLTANEASVGEQQRAEILKLLYRDADILIFDEPTAVLSDDEIKGFLKMLLEFKKLGKTIILITHKLNEVKQVADRATVIRLGKVVETYDVSKTTTQDLANAMVGKHLSKFQNPLAHVDDSKAPVVLEVNNLKVSKISEPSLMALKNISFQLKAGDIVGIAGIEGNGQTELAMALGGLLKPQEGNMRFYYNGSGYIDIEKNNVSTLYRHGISHVPEDRLKYGLILDDTVAMNVVAPQISERPFSRFGFINFREINRYAKIICAEFDVRGAAGGTAYTRGLSGGNQQKLVIGRELSRLHKLLIIVQPTRGLDLGAIQFIHQKMIKDAESGSAILLISYELDEIFDISNKIMVMEGGEIVYQGKTKDTTREQVGKFISRVEHKRMEQEIHQGVAEVQHV
ncbi:sugar ABC transporter [Bacilli bacterium]|nr:sugar ABC transporter [Bacilli bacterium]